MELGVGKELNLVNFSPRDPGSRLQLNRSLANSYVSRADGYNYKVSQSESSLDCGNQIFQGC